MSHVDPNGRDRSAPPFAPAGQEWLWWTLGQVDANTRQMLTKLGDHDKKFETGERRMSRIETSLSALRSKSTTQAINGWEIALKRPVPLLIALVALIVTGKIDVVTRLLEALAKLVGPV